MYRNKSATSIKPSRYRRSVSVSDDQCLLAVGLTAVAVLLLLVAIWYLVSISSVQKHRYSPQDQLRGIAQDSDAVVVAESLNYHGSRLPRDFPVELVGAHVGSLLSSQEMNFSDSNTLKFVSFTSHHSQATLASYYQAYLLEHATSPTITPGSGGGISLSARSGQASYHITIQPYERGSSVAIYYLLKR